MTKYVKLPNDQIVAVDENGFITIQIEMDLSAFIDNDLDGLLDLLSSEATGTEVLSNISHSVVGHHGNALSIKVSGSIEMIDVEEIDIESLPMQEFEAEVIRVGYGNRTVRLSARTIEEARDIADDDAGNHLYPEHTAEYIIEARQVFTSSL
jgi:hypothetical protein